MKIVINRTVKINSTSFDIKPLSVLCNNTNVITNSDVFAKNSENANCQSSTDFS